MNDSVPPSSLSAEPDDVALMLRVKHGDMEAFEMLVLRHQHSVVGTVTKMLGGASDSEDIAQQVFVRVWKSASRYEPKAKFTTWLMTITRNLVFNESRRRQRARLVPMENEDEESSAKQFVDEAAEAPNVEMLGQELQLVIESAITSLPENQRMAIILRRFEEMPYEDIAKVLKLSIPSVKSVLFRARAELKEKLRKYLE